MTDRSLRASTWSLALVLSSVSSGVSWGEEGSGRPPPAGRPVSIELAFAMARAASESLAASNATLDSARARVLRAESAYLPQINVDASYQRTIRSEFDQFIEATGVGAAPLGELPFAQKNIWRVGLNGSLSIWSGGRIESEVRAAEAGVAGARVQLDSVRAQVVLDAAQGYYDAALAERLVEISQATLAQAEEALSRASTLFQQGSVTEFDVLRAKVARDNERTNVINALSQRRVRDADLRRILGVRGDVPLLLTSSLEADSDLEAVEHAAQRGAGTTPSTERAPVREAVAIVNARLADLGRARAERFPTLALTSQLGIVDYPSDVWFDREWQPWRTNFSVMVVASFPLFTGFRRTADIRAARSMVAWSRARLAETTELARLDELEAAEQVEASQAIFEQTGGTVEQAVRAYELAWQRYEAGVATHLDLVDARVLLQQARANRARAGHDLRVARVRRAVLPGLPLALPTTFVITTASGTTPVPLPQIPATPRAAPAGTSPVAPATITPTEPIGTSAFP